MTHAPQPITDPIVRLAAPPERLTIGHHNGPGLRLIFWVQGCSLLCTRHCLNPHLLKRDGGFPVAASALSETLLRFARNYREAEGVTVLGGEPFDQAEALAAALAPVRAAGLSIMVYSGHTLEDLQSSAGATRLLDLCDLLVDGPFVEELFDDTLVWRGSRNQRILRLSDRYNAEAIESAILSQRRAAAFSVGSNGDLAVSGAQSIPIARRLSRLI